MYNTRWPSQLKKVHVILTMLTQLPWQTIPEELIASATGQDPVPSSNVRLHYSLGKTISNGKLHCFCSRLVNWAQIHLVNSANFLCNNRARSMRRSPKHFYRSALPPLPWVARLSSRCRFPGCGCLRCCIFAELASCLYWSGYCDFPRRC